MKDLKRVFLCGFVCASCSLIAVAQEAATIVKSDADRGSEQLIASSAAITPDLSKTVLAQNGTPSMEASLKLALPTAEPMLAMQPLVQQSPKREAIQPSVKEIRLWRGLVIAEHSAALFDAWSTRRSISSGNGYERNPLIKPFANSPAIYPVLQVAPLGVDFLSHRLMRSNNAFLRRVWWVPQVASVGGSLWVGARNIHVADLKR
jgi:hypothetical protein